jgi:hypothetical protein
LLSNTKFNLLATRVLAGQQIPLLEYIRKNNTFSAKTQLPITIREIYGLETAGIGGVERVVAYRKNPLTLRLNIPMPHMFIPPQVSGFDVINHGMFRLAALEILRPREMRYMDGV